VELSVANIRKKKWGVLCKYNKTLKEICQKRKYSEGKNTSRKYVKFSNLLDGLRTHIGKKKPHTHY
jgi:hypothetical protein